MSKAKRERTGGRERGQARQDRAAQKEAERLAREAKQARKDEQDQDDQDRDAETERRRQARMRGR